MSGICEVNEGVSTDLVSLLYSCKPFGGAFYVVRVLIGMVDQGQLTK